MIKKGQVAMVTWTVPVSTIEDRTDQKSKQMPYSDEAYSATRDQLRNSLCYGVQSCCAVCGETFWMTL